MLTDGGPHVRTRYSFLFLELLQNIDRLMVYEIDWAGNGSRMNFRCFSFHDISTIDNFHRISVQLILSKKNAEFSATNAIYLSLIDSKCCNKTGLVKGNAMN